MNKKRGFTLVELLAVIVVLAVILVIAVPNIIKIIDKTKTDAYKRNQDMMINATRNYVASNNDRLPININETTKILLSELITNNIVSNIKDLKDNSNCDGYVLITKINNNKYNYTPYLNCTNYKTNDIIDEGLILNYKLDNNAIDSSTNGINGTVVNAVGASNRFNENNKVLSFNNPTSSNSYISANYETKSEYILSNTFTFSAWIYANGAGFPWSGYGFLLKKGTAYASGGSYSLAYHSSGSVFYAFIRKPDDSGYEYLSWSAPIKDQWYHLTFSFNNGVCKLYLNGSLYKTQTLTFTSMYQNASPLEIGSGYFNGKLDNLKLYNRTLSLEEIQYIYNNELISD